jgi:NADH dehydrogenase/NADH:ubiquinone oxidoreductase subunit G
VRQALDAGARLVTIDPRDSNLARYTDDWLRPLPGREGLLLKALGAAPRDGKAPLAAAAKDAAVDASALERAADIVSSSERLAVIVGPQAFHYGDTEALVDGIMALAGRNGTNVIPLYFGANARGALELGIYQDAGPGVLAEILAGSRRPKVLFLIGDIPFLDRPDCDFLIVQDTFLPPFPVDAFLPAASFAEAGGTLVNLEGRVQEIVQIESPPESPQNGFMRPDWRILADLANVLGCHGMSYKTPQDVFKDIRRAVPGFPAGTNRRPRRLPAGGVAAGTRAEPVKAEPGEFLLVAKPGGYRHRGVDISSKVGGLKELGLEEGLRMNPQDLEALGLRDGDRAALSLGGGRPVAAGPVKEDVECPRGAVYFVRPVVFGGLESRRELLPLGRIGRNPARVQVSGHEP